MGEKLLTGEIILTPRCSPREQDLSLNCPPSHLSAASGGLELLSLCLCFPSAVITSMGQDAQDLVHARQVQGSVAPPYWILWLHYKSNRHKAYEQTLKSLNDLHTHKLPINVGLQKGQRTEASTALSATERTGAAGLPVIPACERQGLKNSKFMACLSLRLLWSGSGASYGRVRK